MIYLDHHAAAPLSPAALDTMERVREIAWANPSSPHRAGRAARAVLEQAREQVANALGAASADVVLTSGGTEACNLGIRGLVRPGDRVVTTRIEHPAVKASIASLEKVVVQIVPVQFDCLPQAEAFDAVDEHTVVVLGWVNHETGTCMPILEIARRARERGARVFIDATQAFGKVDVDVSDVDALAIASHKIRGPAGAGALWVRRGLDLDPVLVGGEQERGRRAGTPDVIAAAGFGAACLEIESHRAAMPDVERRRDRLHAWLEENGCAINAALHPRAATVVNASVPEWRGDVLVAALDVEGLCAASGAACSSGKSEPSPVLRCLYPDEPWRAESALRLSVGTSTTDREIEEALEILGRVLTRPQATSK